jgi:tRNA (mo5U34)-methyltransferase
MDTIESLAPWFYEFDLGPIGRTESLLPADLKPIHLTRLEMVQTAIGLHFSPERLRGIRCLDVGCHEGYYSVAAARLGTREVLGLDIREENLKRARFVARSLGLANVQFERCNVEQVSPERFGKYELTFFLGLLYHVENPMLCLRNMASVTSELCVLETQVVDEVEAIAEWGSRKWSRPYQGILALIDESAEYDASNREVGSTPLATCPSPRALEVMLKHAGFKRVEFIDPPANAYEQHARRKRVVCAAWK